MKYSDEEIEYIKTLNYAMRLCVMNIETNCKNETKTISLTYNLLKIIKLMKAHKILGIILIILSILFFGLFVWWGTTTYNGEFAVGILLIVVLLFITGIIAIYNPIETKNK